MLCSSCRRRGRRCGYYQAALDGEREKYRLGLNSLVDVLTVEDRLTTGVLAEVNARLAYALALVQVTAVDGDDCAGGAGCGAGRSDGVCYAAVTSLGELG